MQREICVASNYLIQVVGYQKYCIDICHEKKINNTTLRFKFELDINA